MDTKQQIAELQTWVSIVQEEEAKVAKWQAKIEALKAKAVEEAVEGVLSQYEEVWPNEIDELTQIAGESYKEATGLPIDWPAIRKERALQLNRHWRVFLQDGDGNSPIFGYFASRQLAEAWASKFSPIVLSPLQKNASEVINLQILP